MSRYQELVAFARRVRPFTYILRVYTGAGDVEDALFVVQMMMSQEVYNSIKSFEPWEPRTVVQNVWEVGEESGFYLNMMWEIRIEEVLEEYPIDGLGHRPRADWMQARVKEVAG